MKVTLPYQVVLVVRGEGSKTPKVVLPHEVPILRMQFGDEAIVETDDKPHIESQEFDTEEEYVRLQESYRGDADNPNPTASVFRNLRDFEAAFKNVQAAPVPPKPPVPPKLAAGADEKTALIAEAKSLGINANKNWGIEKLKTEIAAKKPAAPAGDENDNDDDN